MDHQKGLRIDVSRTTIEITIIDPHLKYIRIRLAVFKTRTAAVTYLATFLRK